MANANRKPDAEEKTEEVDVFDLDRIGRLVELMKEHGLNELDLRQARQQIRLTRGVAAPPSSVVAQPQPAPGNPSAAATAGEDAEADPNMVLIRSPMIGTFYSKPNPNADSFVKVGEHVQEETTVCMVEAMKVFNEIPAEVRGKIVAVLVNDEEPVDFGRPLFKVDTSN